MTIEASKITAVEVEAAKVQNAKDDYIGTPAVEVKKIFDKLPLKTVEKHNSLIDRLISADGAKSVGTMEGNLQAVLDKKATKTELALKAGIIAAQQWDSDILEEAKEYTDNKAFESGSADMFKREYDMNSDGKVDSAEAADFAERAEFAENGGHTLTHSRSGTLHTLVGELPTSGLVTVRFKALANFVENDTFRIGTASGGYVTYTAKPTGGETKLPDKAFITNDIVTAELDIGAKKINFKIGGGGSAKLNIFTQTATPVIKDGVWIKTADKYTSIVDTDNPFGGIAYSHTTTVSGTAMVRLSEMTGAALGNNIYIFPEMKSINTSSAGYYKKCIKYNASSNTVTETVADRPKQQYAKNPEITVAWNGQILNVLGSSSGGAFLYNPSTDTYQKVTPVISPMHVFVVGDEMFYNNTLSSHTDYRKYIAINLKTRTTRVFLTASEVDSLRSAGAYLGNSALSQNKDVTGNEAYFKLSSSLFGINVVTKTSRNFKFADSGGVADKLGSFGCSVFRFGNMCYVLSPEMATGQYGLIVACNIATGVWSVISNNTLPLRTNAVTVRHNDLIYIISGQQKNGHEYYPVHTDAEVRNKIVLRITTKSFPTGALVVYADKNSINHKASVIKDAKIDLPLVFTDIWLSKSNALQEYPTYIGDGSTWNKIKN